MSQSQATVLDDEAFDKAMIDACFRMAAAVGWPGVRMALAAHGAGLSPARARSRFPCRSALLVRLGRLADAAALREITSEGSVRDRLFALLMRRLDVFQHHRDGVLALLSALPLRPRTTLTLGALTTRSMRWMLDAADVDTAGPLGRLRVKGLVAVWLWTIRAWQRDDTTDLAPTMAALDQALARAERYAGWLPGSSRSGATAAEASPGEQDAAETEPHPDEAVGGEPHQDEPPASPDDGAPPSSG